MNEGPCIYCDNTTSEGRFESFGLTGEPDGFGFAHEKCRKLWRLRMEAHADRKLKANPHDRATQVMARLFTQMADHVCGTNYGDKQS